MGCQELNLGQPGARQVPYASYYFSSPLLPGRVILSTLTSYETSAPEIILVCVILLVGRENSKIFEDVGFFFLIESMYQCEIQLQTCT